MGGGDQNGWQQTWHGAPGPYELGGLDQPSPYTPPQEHDALTPSQIVSTVPDLQPDEIQQILQFPSHMWDDSVREKVGQMYSDEYLPY